MKFQKHNREQYDRERIVHISHKFGVTDDVAEILLQRGLTQDDEIQKFLNPSLENMHDPFLFNDMDKVVARVKSALKDREKILIFGDYDVDGITSSYILLDYFRSVGCDADTFLPNRYSDGYGLTRDAVNFVIRKFNPSLIITVDCGISGFEEVEYIQSQGIDVIVTDHHDCPEVIPNCLVIDAKIPNQRYPFRELCGAGVALKLVEALSNKDTMKKYLPVCAIATVSDIVPLVDENRIIVKFGLDAPLKAFPEGIVALCKELKLGNKITSQDISFKLAPKLNASGRMGDANHSLKLYIEKDKNKIRALVAQILEYNTERQELCNVVYVDCINRLKNMNLADKKAIILYSDKWSIGILGIVAARLTDEYRRPTFLLGKEGEFYKGSCRSIEGVDVHNVLTQMPDLLESFGGHVMAAGMTVPLQKITDFEHRVEAVIDQDYGDEYFEPYCEYDLDIDLDDISVDRLKALSVLEPFGCQNITPVFRLKFEKVTVTPMKSNAAHLNVATSAVNLLAFNSGQYFNLLSQSGAKECIAELWVDTYRGAVSCKGIIKHLQICAAPNVGEERIGGEYLKQLALHSDGVLSKYTTYNKHNLSSLLAEGDGQLYGTLVIAHTLKSYKDFCEHYASKCKILCYEYLNLTSNCGYNTVCLCPAINNDYHNFSRIILLDSVLDEAYLVYLNSCTRAQIYLPSSTPFLYSPFRFLDLSRRVFGDYFHIFKKACKSNIIGYDDYNFYNKLKKLQKDLNYVQFVACLLTFEQLGLLQINDETGNYYVKMTNRPSTTLNNSNFYNKLELILKSY